MNISYNWLKEYIDLPLTPDETAAALTSIGLETGSVEEVESIRGGLRGIVIGKVLTCVDHPDSDHLHVTTVDLGDGTPTQIVCGAPNVAAGQTVVVATVGAKLYDGDKEFAIKKSKIRGVESLGMICAEDEIGVGSSHDGIIVIDADVKPGTPAAEHFGLTSDYVLEVDLTPNRIDAASHYGVARDLAAWMATHRGSGRLRRPEPEGYAIEAPEGGITVSVDNTRACPRYSGVTVRGVTVKESPKWLCDRLNAIGVRPINNIVDITNYMLHALGQPLHCFDTAKIEGGRIVVRNATEGEKFTTLDGVERTLSGMDLMICDAVRPMCMAGVFGGLDSGVTEQTTDIFLESAYFNPTTVRRTARRHGLNTDSSFRFERGVDPNGTIWVLRLAAMMVKELAGGRITGPEVDIYPEHILPAEVTLGFGYLDRLVGKEMPRDTVVEILRSLEMELTGLADSEVSMKVPTYRVDVTRPCDVAEDVLRIYGYNNVEISSTLHSALTDKTFDDESQRLRRLVSEQLTAEGFNEIMCNSLTAESYYADLAELPADRCVKLLNPLSADLSVMRQTLLFGGLESLAHNINRKTADLAMYEFGNVYWRNPELAVTTESPLAPFGEGMRLALWLTGAIRPASWLGAAEEATPYHLKGIVANIFARLGISPAELKVTTVQTELLAAGIAIATRSGKPLATLGIVARKIAAKADVKQTVVYAEIDWTALVKLSLKKKVLFTPLPKTMPVKRDLALLIDKDITMAQVEATVRESEKKLLRDVSLFDVYEGKNLPEGKKSYAISMTLQDDEKTLTDKQIEASMAKIVANLTKRLGASLR